VESLQTQCVTLKEEAHDATEAAALEKTLADGRLQEVSTIRERCRSLEAQLRASASVDIPIEAVKSHPSFLELDHELQVARKDAQAVQAGKKQVEQTLEDVRKQLTDAIEAKDRF